MSTTSKTPMPVRIRALTGETDQELIDQANAAISVLSARFHTRTPPLQAFYASNRALEELRQIEEELRQVEIAERRRAERTLASANTRRRAAGAEASR